jgi:cyclopropane-fatty-acyl-phospholipid synthase
MSITKLLVSGGQGLVYGLTPHVPYGVIITCCVIACIAYYSWWWPDPHELILRLLETHTAIRVVRGDAKHKLAGGKEGTDAAGVAPATIIVKSPHMFDKIFTKAELGFAESYMDGDWDTNDLELTLHTILKKRTVLTDQINSMGSIKLLLSLLYARYIKRGDTNALTSSKKNVSHHYNTGTDLFQKMLGEHMQYTCAYFHSPGMTLDDAQLAKMELVATKLNLKPGMTVLDIGCGYGSLAHYLASRYDVHVTGVTLSEDQVMYANMHYAHPRVRIECKDYRHVTGIFDRVYSIGMFEHVGQKNYHEYYDTCHSLLSRDGIMLLHTIGTHYYENNSDPNFMSTYIFPGGELPDLPSLAGPYVDRWHIEDLQNFGLSYAKTLRSWRANIGDWDGLDTYSTRFRRMWDFYLCGCAANFQIRNVYLWQIVYTKRDSERPDDCHHIRQSGHVRLAQSQ